jgi:hypothetical protein
LVGAHISDKDTRSKRIRQIESKRIKENQKTGTIIKLRT